MLQGFGSPPVSGGVPSSLSTFSHPASPNESCRSNSLGSSRLRWYGVANRRGFVTASKVAASRESETS